MKRTKNKNIESDKRLTWLGIITIAISLILFVVPIVMKIEADNGGLVIVIASGVLFSIGAILTSWNKIQQNDNKKK
jgi:hypothetical protein